jgi:hypothetical protein
MIIDDFDLVSVSVPPSETKTPLVVDPNAMVPLSFPLQSFQTIARRCSQIAQFCGAVQLPELSAGDLLNSLKAPTAFAVVKPLGFGTPERLDHKLHCILYTV